MTISALLSNHTRPDVPVDVVTVSPPPDGAAKGLHRTELVPVQVCGRRQQVVHVLQRAAQLAHSGDAAHPGQRRRRRGRRVRVPVLLGNLRIQPSPAPADVVQRRGQREEVAHLLPLVHTTDSQPFCFLVPIIVSINFFYRGLRL